MSKQMFRLRRWLPLVGVLAAAAVLPLVPIPTYYQSIIVEILIFSIVAMSADLLIGFTGLVPLGQAALLAAGGYAAGLVGSTITGNLFVTLLSAVLCAGAVALVIGYFSIRGREVYFLMLTLAFGQLVFSVVHEWTSLTGGSDGMVSIPRPSLGALRFNDPTVFFYLVIVVTLLSLWFLRRVIGSPFGQVLLGIKENEHRVLAVGYDVQRYKLAAFTLAGMVAGVAGWLYSGFYGYISPDISTWVVSGEIVLMVVIGGSGTLYGSVLGATLVLVLSRVLSSYTDRWQTIMGVVFAIVVLLRPEGLLTIFRRRLAGTQTMAPVPEPADSSAHVVANATKGVE